MDLGAQLKASMQNPQDDSISIKTQGKENIGINVEGSAERGFFIKDVEHDSIAKASGKIETGDQLTGITIDLNTLSLEEAQSILKVLSPYPVKISVKKASHDLSIDALSPSDIHLLEKDKMIDSGIEIKGPKIETNMPKMFGKKIGIDVQSPTGNITFDSSLQKDLNIAAETLEGNEKSKGYLIKFPKFSDKVKIAQKDIEGDISLNTGTLAEGELNVSAEGTELETKAQKSKGGFHIGFPKFGMKGKTMREEVSVSPEVEINLKESKGARNININQPTIGISGKGHDLNVSTEAPDIDVKTTKGSGGFHIGMPKFGMKGKTPKGDFDVNLPEGDLKLDVDQPDADVNLKGSGAIDINLPTFGISGKGPKLEGDVDAGLSLPRGGVDVKGELPDVDIDAKAPKGKGGFHIGLPSLPKVSLKGKGIKGEGDFDVDLPDADLNVSAEAPDIDVKAPKGSGGFHIGMPKFGMKGKAPKGDFDVNLPEGDLKLDASLPDADVNLKGPKGSGGFNINLPSFGISGKGPKLEGDVDAGVSLPKGGIDVKGELPDVDMDAKAPKGKGGFHIGLPSLPKVSLKGKGIKGEGDFDVDLPDADLNVSAEAPDIDVKAPKGSGGFHIGMPKFGMKGKAPKGGVEVELPEADVDLKAELPDADIDLKAPKGSGGFHIGLPSLPKVNLKGKGIKGEGDLNVDLPDADLNVSADVPDIDVKAPKGSGGFHIGMPKFGMKGKAPKGGVEVDIPEGDINVKAGLPDADIDVKAPKGKGGFNFGFPKFGMKGKAPKGGLDVELPNADINAGIDVNAPKGSGGFNIELPSFGLDAKGPSGGVDVDAGLSSPKGGLEIKGDLPDVDIDVKAPKGKGGFHIGLPSLPKVSLKGKGIKGEGGVDVDLPDADLNVSAEAPDIDVKAPKGSGGFHIGMPKFGMKGKAPKGDFDVNLPEGDLKLDASLPDADVKLKGQKGSGGININLPSFGISGKGPKLEGDVDAGMSLPKGGIDVKGELPDVDIDAKAPKGKGGFNIGLPSLPKVNLKGKGIKGEGGVDVDLPDADLNLSADAPDIDLKAPKGSGGFHIGMPKFGMKGKTPKGHLDVDLPDADIDLKAELPDAHIDAKTPKGSGFHIGMPKFGMKGKSPKGGLDVDLPEGGIDLKSDLPDADIDVKASKVKSGHKYSFPKFGMKGKSPKGGFDVDYPKDDINAGVALKAPKGSGDFKIELPSFGLDAKGPSGGSNVDGVDFPQTEFDLNSQQYKGGLDVVLPNVSRSSVEINPSIDVGGLGSLSGKADLSAGVGTQKIEFQSKGPSIDVHGGVSPSVTDEGDISGKVKSKGGFHFGLPKIGGKGKAKRASGLHPSASDYDAAAASSQLDKNYGIQLPSFNLTSQSLHAEADLSGSSTHGGVGVDLDAGFQRPSSHYQVGFPKLSGKSQSVDPGLNIALHSQGTYVPDEPQRLATLPRDIESETRKGKFNVRGRPKSMDIHVSASDQEINVDYGTEPKKKRHKKGFIQRVKDLFNTSDSKTSPSSEFSSGMSPEHPDFKEKSTVSTVSITHGDTGTSFKPMTSPTKEASETSAKMQTPKEDVKPTEFAVNVPSLSVGVESPAAYSVFSSRTVTTKVGGSGEKSVQETVETRRETKYTKEGVLETHHETKYSQGGSVGLTGSVQGPQLHLERKHQE